MGGKLWGGGMEGTDDQRQIWGWMDGRVDGRKAVGWMDGGVHDWRQIWGGWMDREMSKDRFGVDGWMGG